MTVKNGDTARASLAVLTAKCQGVDTQPLVAEILTENGLEGSGLILLDMYGQTLHYASIFLTELSRRTGAPVEELLAQIGHLQETELNGDHHE